MKRIKKYPFLLMIIGSTLIFTVLGFCGRNNVYKAYTVKLLETPRLATFFQGVGEGVFPWTSRIEEESIEYEVVQKDSNSVTTQVREEVPAVTIPGNKAESLPVADTDLIEENEKGLIVPPIINTSDNNVKKVDTFKTETKNAKVSQIPTKGVKEEGINLDPTGEEVKEENTEEIILENEKTSSTSNKGAANQPENAFKAEESDRAGSRIQEDSTTEEDENRYQFETVTKEYFDDALFIGDSRTVGLSEYSDLSNSTFYADVGLTIYDIFNKKVAELEGSKVTIPEALKVKHFKKIYIMLGINELGRGTTQTFVDEYKKVITKLKELQPDTLIFVEGIMNVSKEKSDKDPIFNNTNIKEKNDNIALLADNEKIFYIDVNEAITDKTGNLPSKYTFDYIHLKAAYYQLWTEFLLKHGIKTE